MKTRTMRMVLGFSSTVLASLVFGCHKTEPRDEKCLLREAYPDRITFKPVVGPSAVMEFRYDAENRVIAVSNFNGSAGLTISYFAADSLYAEWEAEGKLFRTTRAFDIAGNHSFSRTVCLNRAGDTSYLNEFRYSYDNLRQRVRAVSSYDARYNTPGAVGDSINYVWQGGNVISATSREFGIFQYGYTTHAADNFFYNTPTDLSNLYSYLNFNEPIQSRFLVGTVSSAGAEVGSYAYDFDTLGRVVTMTADVGQVKLTNTPAGVYDIRYRCN